MNVSLLKDSKSYHKYSTSSTSKAGSSGSRNRSMRLSSVSSAGGIPKNGSSQHQNFSTPISSSEFDRNISSVDLQRVRLLCATAGVSIIGFRSQCENLTIFPLNFTWNKFFDKLNFVFGLFLLRKFHKFNQVKIQCLWNLSKWLILRLSIGQNRFHVKSVW